MTDYGQQWEEQQARRLEAHIGRTSARAELLRDRYLTAGAMVAGERPPGVGPAPRGRDEQVRRVEGAGRVPVNLGALDLTREVEQAVARLEPLARGALRLGLGSALGGTVAERTADRLGWLGHNLGLIWSEDPYLGTELSDEIWKLDRRAALVLGERARAFPLSEPCSRCEIPALWASPELMQVRCGNPDCEAGWTLTAPIPVASTG